MTDPTTEPRHAPLAGIARRGGSRRRSTATRGPSSAALLAAPLGWLVIAYLGSLRPVPHLVVLVGRLVHRQPRHRRRRSTTTSRSSTTAGLPDHRACGRWSWRRSSPLTDIVLALPDRVLHGPGRLDPDARHPRRLDPAAAVVRLPRQGLRLAADPERRTACSTASSRRSACTVPATATRPSGSSRPTCGCRT